MYDGGEELRSLSAGGGSDTLDAVTAPAETISLREAAERLGVHYMTAYRYVRIGKLRADKRGGQWFVDPAELEAFTVGSDPGTRDGSRARAPALLEDRLLAADEPGAWAIVEQALTSGAEPAEIHLRFIIPAMVSIGERWARGEIGVLDEHQATVIANRLTARLGPRFRRRGRSLGTVVLGLVSHDTHTLTTAILADLLRGEHFEVIDLGGNTPPESFAEVTRSADRLVGVGISSSLDESHDIVRATIDAVREVDPTIPIVVGGDGISGEALARSLGADHFAVDAAGVIELFRELAGERLAGH